jgi:uncharacterized protein
MRISSEIKKIGKVPVLECFDLNIPDKRPLVLFFYGFTGRKENHADDACELARRGYFTAVVDAALHGELGEEPFVPAKVVPHFNDIIRETAGFINPLIDHFASDPRVDASRTGLYGISMGGAVIYHYLSERNPEVKAGVSFIAGYTSFWDRTLEGLHTLYPDYGITNEMVAEAHHIESPPFLAGVSDFPLLGLYGEDDPLIPVGSVRKMFEAARWRYTEPEMLSLLTFPGIGHLVSRPMIFQAHNWLQRYISC